jgi:hypothetical protein
MKKITIRLKNCELTEMAYVEVNDVCITGGNYWDGHPLEAFEHIQEAFKAAKIKFTVEEIIHSDESRSCEFCVLDNTIEDEE